MKASYAWLKELTELELTASEMAERLTRAGLEVEGIHPHGTELANVVVAEVRGKRPHPTRDRLNLVTVFDGTREREVVCGAPNVPEAGHRVALADVGAVLPGGFRIEPREVAGVLSEGMLASEKELGIGAEADGILVFDASMAGKPGTPLATALALEDFVLEISLTPNRPDCLGHLGLARELCMLAGEAFLPKLLTTPTKLLAESPEPLAGNGAFTTLPATAERIADTATLVAPVDGIPTIVPIHIADAGRCARYVGTVVERVRVRTSPFWARYRLHVLGQRAIDAVVDATNLILLETGHPIHAFDLEKVRGPRIDVRLAREGETIALLDGTKRTLTADDLVIADAEGPVALAGVMGGSRTAVSSTTQHVLLEVAWFDPRSVRRTSRRHGIHTESSHRFERGVDHGQVEAVARRSLALLSLLADGAPSPTGSDALARTLPAAQIDLSPDYVRAAIGDDAIPEQQMRTILEGLGCVVSPGEESGWRVTAPTHRPDLTRSIDLVEEVARVRGYDLVPDRMLRPAPRPEAGNRRFHHVRAVRKAALAAGLHEAVNFTFVAPPDLVRARVSTNAIALANPLSEERSVMRTSLIPGLLANVSRAERHQRPAGRIAEIGRRYFPSTDAPALETLGLGIALFGPRAQWLGEGQPVDFYDGKGAVEQIGRALGLAVDTVPSEALPGWLHPRRAAAISVAGTHVGFVGEIHPDVADDHGLVTRPILAELELEPILEKLAAKGPSQVRPLPRFQAVVRDLALVIADDVPFARVVEALSTAGGSLVERVEAFDVYRGKPIPEGKKSLALRVTFRDLEATLTDARVEASLRALLDAATGLGADLRS